MKNKKTLWIFILWGWIISMIWLIDRIKLNRCQKQTKKWKDSSDKYYLYTNTFSYWLKNKQMGKSIVDYLQKYGFERIAIYGMGPLGERLLDELKNSPVEVAYAVDKRSDTIWADVEVYSLNEKLPQVDAIIVTALHYFDSIEQTLVKKTNSKIISLEDILYVY